MSSKEFGSFLKLKRELNKSALDDRKHQLKLGIIDAKLEAFESCKSKYKELESKKLDSKLEIQELKVQAAKLEVEILKARLAQERGGTQETEPAI